MMGTVYRILTFPVVGFVLLVIQSAAYHVLPFDWLTPDLVLPLVLFLGLSEVPLSRGAPTAFLLGYLVDLFSGGPIGMHTFVAVVVYLLSRTASLRLFSAGRIFQMLLTFMASLLATCSILFLGFIFGQSLENLGYVALAMVARGTVTALLSPAIFRLARRLEPPGIRQEGSYA